MSSSKKKKLFVIILSAILLIGAAGYTVFLAPALEKEKWAYKETAVEKGTLTLGVTESGSLEYGITSIDYNLNLEIETDEEDEEDEEEDSVQKYLKIEEVYVAAGQRIKAGDAVLKFTEDSVSDVRRLLEGALVDAQVAYNEAEEEYDLSVLEAGTDYDTSQVSESHAAAIYQSSKSAISNEIEAIQIEINQRTNEIPSLEEKLAEAQEHYQEVLEAYEDAKNLAEQISPDNPSYFLTIQSQYFNAQNSYQSAKSAVEQAQDSLQENQAQIEALTAQVQELSARREIDKLEAEQNYQTSVINGKNAQITYEAQLESLKETLQEAETDKKEAQEQLEAFEAFVGQEGILYAEGSGIVTEVAYEAGDSLTSTGNIAAYASPEDMTISVDVTQEDIVALAVGDTAEITFNAYQDESYQGTILSIDTTATSRDSNTISYTVVIGVSGETDKLYGGMTADITFVTESKENVLYISKKALVEQNGKTYVYVKTALGAMELKEVETGISNGVSIEILSGLQEGDVIYIASRISSEEEIEETAKDTGEVQGAAQEAAQDGDTDGFGQDGSTNGLGQDGMMPGSMQEGGMGMPGNMPGAGNNGNSRSTGSNTGGMEARP